MSFQRKGLCMTDDTRWTKTSHKCSTEACGSGEFKTQLSFSVITHCI